MYWFNGQVVEGGELSLSIEDPAFLYGATVFTTLRVYETSLEHRLTAWQAHCDRIRTSLRAFHWQQPDWLKVRQGAEQLAPIYPVLRVTVLPDGRELITGRSLPADLLERQHRGISAGVAPAGYQRGLPGHKTGNYLSCFLAMQEARQRGANEAILANPAGTWLETSTGNLWGWVDDVWWTPPLETGILPGVARSHLVNHLKQQGVSAIAAPFTPTQSRRFACLAYTNCVVQVVPIHTVLDGQTRLEYDPDHAALEQLRSYWS